MTSRPRAIVVAGPSGGGKSALFPVRDFGVDAFNVDDRAAAQNGGSYAAIPLALRQQAQAACEAFVEEHIDTGLSYAVETTLRSTAAIKQTERARARGFETILIFVGTADPAENVRRVALRGHAGGHAATPAEIEDIYARSMANFRRALEVFERIEIWDNSVLGAAPILAAARSHSGWRYFVEPLPPWVPRLHE